MTHLTRQGPLAGPTAYVNDHGTAELRWAGATRTYFLATGRQTGGAFALVDEQAKKGEVVPRHRHANDVESFYVLQGEISFFIDEQPGVRLGPGSFVHVPGGTVHGFRIDSETARYLILTTPRHGEFYRAITSPARPCGSAPLEAIDSSQIGAACGEFDVEFIGPLPA